MTEWDFFKLKKKLPVGALVEHTPIIGDTTMLSSATLSNDIAAGLQVAKAITADFEPKLSSIFGDIEYLFMDLESVEVVPSALQVSALTQAVVTTNVLRQHVTAQTSAANPAAAASAVK